MSRARELADAGSKANFLDNVSSDINTQFTTINSSLSTTNGKVTSFVGCIQAFAQDCSSLPTGWLICDGSSNLNTYTYRALHAVISNVYGGTAYNAGTTDQSGETTTFTIPDLRGDFLRCADQGRSTSDSGRAHGSAQSQAYHSAAWGYTNMQARYHTGGTGYNFSNWQIKHSGYPNAYGAANTSTNAFVAGWYTLGNGIGYNNMRLTVGSGGDTRPRNVAVQFCIRWQD